MVGTAGSLLFGGCLDPVGFASEKPVPLTYVGQISFGEPIKSDNRVIIPVSYAGGQWLMNSAWVPYGMDVEVKDGAISFTDKVSLPGNNHPEAVRQIVLPGSTHGVFRLRYKDPDGTSHDIGSVYIRD